ncbi:MAG: hypothetical protein AABX00_00040 [Nanoarchaeota archaeon]
MAQTIDEVVQGIVHDIERAPSTFLNLATIAGTEHEVFGPRPLGNKDETPRYGFTDELISTAKSTNTDELFYIKNLRYCGSIFLVNPRLGEGLNALTLMMRLARAGVIIPANYSEGMDLDAWKVVPEATASIRELVEETGTSLPKINENIVKLVNPTTSSKSGKAFYEWIAQHYQ